MLRKVFSPGFGEHKPIRSLFAVFMAIWACTFAEAQDPAAVGQWSKAKFSAEAIHMQVLPNGKVMYWNRLTFEGRTLTTPFLWDPTSGINTAAAPAPWDIFCGGHTLLPDGRLMVTGGAIAAFEGYAGAATYDPTTDTWTELPDMNKGRWYPTDTVLPTGDVLVTSGDDEEKRRNTLPQVWQVNSASWRDLSDAQLLLNTYPRMLVAPNGKLFNAGPGQTSRYLDPSGTGAWTAVGNINFGVRTFGPAAMYDDGKVLVVGGGDPPTATAEVIDLNAPSPAWQYTGSMAFARRQHNATLLPDGTVLVTGGTSGGGFDNASAPVYPAELWDPTTGNWATLASMTFYRGYHSTAALLPDGRVLSAGGDLAGTTFGEVFSPPYLFKGVRPTITSAPASTTYGQTFFVGTPDAAAITQVAWIGLSVVTHAFNQNQRINRLSFVQTDGGLSVTAPASANLCPPGHYMLFLLNALGVPSVAQVVQVIGSGSPAANLSVSNLTFTDQSVNTTSASQTFTLTNPGTNNLNIAGLVASGDYAQTNTCIPALAPGATCTVSVTFAPTAAGTRTGTITITDDAGSSPQIVSLTGTGIGAPLASLSPMVKFLPQPVGTVSGGKTATLTNAGVVTLNISSIAINGDFSQKNTCGPSLAPAASCTITIGFRPTATGARTGALTITDDASNSPQTFPLTGTGTNVKLLPAVLKFALQSVGTTGPAQNATLTNVGSTTLSVSSITISGSNAGDFAQTNTCGSSIAGGASCTISVTFVPSSTGSKTATVNVNCSDPASPRKIALSGTGQ